MGTIPSEVTVLSGADYDALAEAVGYDAATTVAWAHSRLVELRRGIENGRILRIECPRLRVVRSVAEFDAWVRSQFPVFANDTLHRTFLSPAPLGGPCLQEAMRAWGCVTADAFGDSPEMADELGQLIVNGIKTATCGDREAWRLEGEEPSGPGDRELVLDGGGRPLCVIEYTDVCERRFCDVDDDHAFAEGEGDRTLASWRAGHRAFFERNGGFSPEMQLVCSRFRLVHVFER